MKVFIRFCLAAFFGSFFGSATRSAFDGNTEQATQMLAISVLLFAAWTAMWLFELDKRTGGARDE